MKNNASVIVLLACLVTAVFIPMPLQAQDGNAYAAENRRAQQERPRGNQRDGQGPRREPAELKLPADVALLDRLSLVLGRPTAKSVTVSVLSAESAEAYVEYGSASGAGLRKTAMFKLPAGDPVEVLLDQLAPDKSYVYRLFHRKPGEARYVEGEKYAFHTARAPGSKFVFEIQGDSHPERSRQFSSDFYAQTLRAAATDAPDFYMTIGDDFSVDTLPVVNAQTVTRRYQVQRPFLSLVARAAPLFLVNGNHEQAAAYNLNGTPDNVAVWAQTARNRFFPQPAPDGFYSGNNTPVPFIGLLRDYYAWTWGDALFVVIDPYWHSMNPVDNVYGGGSKNRNLWAVTLGDAQYKWLKQTLESSKAKYKFVFAHHVLGIGRGGIEQAGLYEWGGKDPRGEDQFAQRRPNWSLPIHQLMAKNGVTIFFQGHDHLFARQQLDGVIYQTLPSPANPFEDLRSFASAYRSGDVLTGAGRVRVSVAPEKVRVDLVRTPLPGDATKHSSNGEIAFSYEVGSKSPFDRQ